VSARNPCCAGVTIRHRSIGEHACDDYNYIEKNGEYNGQNVAKKWRRRGRQVATASDRRIVKECRYCGSDSAKSQSERNNWRDHLKSLLSTEIDRINSRYGWFPASKVLVVCGGWRTKVRLNDASSLFFDFGHA
jgi:hypothetical protein